MPQPLDGYVRRWNLTPDGEPVVTHSSHLLPVVDGGISAMLKVALAPEERLGNRWMTWADGDGTASVIRQEADGLLMHRARGSRSLVRTVAEGRDEQATRVICEVVARLHNRNRAAPDWSPPLTDWFRPLVADAAHHGGAVAVAADVAQQMIATQNDVTALHGDIHHGNILDFGRDGWRAIDPKGLVGERCFDYANLFCNPDHASATARFEDRLGTVSTVAGIPTQRLLGWILAWCGLSAVWHIAAGTDPRTALAIGEMAAAHLNPQAGS